MKPAATVHATRAVHLRRVDKWVVVCDVCGEFGPCHEREADARAIAERHQEKGGFEKGGFER